VLVVVIEVVVVVVEVVVVVVIVVVLDVEVAVLCVVGTCRLSLSVVVLVVDNFTLIFLNY
jgi:hypothetical protein